MDRQVGESPRQERLPARIYAASVASIYAGAFVLLWYPMLFIATWVQELGRQRGWWAADNDPEASLAATLGLVVAGGVLTVAAAVTLTMASVLDRRMKGAFATVLAASAAVVLGHTVIGVLLFRR